MLLDVLAIICDTTGCDAGFSHQLKADFPTQIIWNLTFLKKQNTLNHTGVTGKCSSLVYFLLVVFEAALWNISTVSHILKKESLPSGHSNSG